MGGHQIPVTEAISGKPACQWDIAVGTAQQNSVAIGVLNRSDMMHAAYPAVHQGARRISAGSCLG